MGIHFDEKLRWGKQVSEMTIKVKRNLYALQKAARSKWGISQLGLKQLYIGAIRPILLYGALSWGSICDVKRLITKVESAQRLALLGITNCLRTTSNSALQVIAGIPPVKLMIEEKMANHLVRIKSNDHLDNRIEPLQESIKQRKTKSHHQPNLFAAHNLWNNDYPRVELENIHPALYTKLEVEVSHETREKTAGLIVEEINLNLLKEETFVIFTDASKREESKVGIGIIIRNKSETVIIKGKIKEEHSIFRGEAVAILQALNAIKIIATNNEEIVLYSDSKSTLQALKAPLPQDFTIKEIKELAVTMNVKFKWVPAHLGIDLNELADKVAKSAIDDSEAVHFNVDTTIKCKKIMRQRTLTKWQEEWSNALTGRETNKILPNVTLEGYCLLENDGKWAIALRNRAISNHIPYGFYLKRFNLKNDDKCLHCNETETVEHVLLKCPRFIALRFQHQNRKENAPNLTKENIFTLENRTLLTTILKIRAKDELGVT